MSPDPERAQRAPLDQAVLTARLHAAAWPWPLVEIVTETRSTNADVAERAAAGAPHGTVVVTDYQSAGRGRLGRRWEAAPSSSLMFSALLRPHRDLGPAAGWTPLLVGVAVCEGLARGTELPLQLKWPNDILIGGQKLGGVLVERSSDGAVIAGVGINVDLTPEELPGPAATSLALAGATDLVREDLLAAVLPHLAAWWERWQSADFDAERSGLAAAYTDLCSTLGRQVTVTFPNDEVSNAVAVGIGADGALLVRPSEAAASEPLREIRAADVVHVRPE